MAGAVTGDDVVKQKNKKFAKKIIQMEEYQCYIVSG